jgi:hypothetical protein
MCRALESIVRAHREDDSHQGVSLLARREIDLGRCANIFAHDARGMLIAV